MNSPRIVGSMIALLVLQTAGIARAEEIETDQDSLCSSLDKAFVRRNWGSKPCGQAEWNSDSTSVQGRPILYAEFGPKDAKNTTLVFSMVHGDEITPLYMGFQLAKWAEANMARFPDTRLVIAPLLNPDGFLGFPKTRTNAHGVDCNRNFNTKDWKKEAVQAWKKKFRSDKRRFPGYKPDSEPETLFQKKLIEQTKPSKIISIHSPLNMMDYDGPDHLKLSRFTEEYVEKCEELRIKLKAKSGGFYPGSLGNYAGNDLGIPTITLELPTANPNQAKNYWEKFKKGLETAIRYQIPPKGSP